MKASPKLSNLQLELLKLFSFEVSEEQVKDIKALLVQYFSNQITHDMDALFEFPQHGRKCEKERR